MRAADAPPAIAAPTAIAGRAERAVVERRRRSRDLQAQLRAALGASALATSGIAIVDADGTSAVRAARARAV